MLKFAKQFLVHPISTGAIAPSSRALAKKVCELADIDSAKTIVEIGPGSGSFTKMIQAKRSPESTFFAIEINPELAEQAREECPGVEIITDCGTKIGDYLNKHGVEHCDTVVGGLPWANLPEDVQKRLLSAIIDALTPDGKYVTFTYMHSRLVPMGRRFKKLLEENFSKVLVSRMVWKNLPPAVVYCAIGPKKTQS